jgi:hypothetical protein
MVDADIDMVFRSGDAHNGLRPIGFSTKVINISPYRRFEFLAGRRIGFAPIRAVFTSLNLGFNLFSRIAHGIAFLPHLSLSLL